MTLIDCDDLRHRLNVIINAKPFDCEPFTDGQYAGLRQAVRMLNETPAAKCECDRRELP